jgi:hypothetical protein
MCKNHEIRRRCLRQLPTRSRKRCNCYIRTSLLMEDVHLECCNQRDHLRGNYACITVSFASRVRNPSSEIFNVMCTPPSVKNSSGPRRSSHSDSFTRLFGTPENKVTPRRASLTKQGKERKKCESFLSSRIVLNRSILWKIFVKWFESIVTDVTNRNPVTGDGVASWDQKPLNRTSPRIHNGTIWSCP